MHMNDKKEEKGLDKKHQTTNTNNRGICEEG